MVFPLIPNAGLSEILTWKTDVLRTIDGTESRIALYQYPRREIAGDFGPYEDSEYESVVKILRDAIQTVDEFPVWQYSSGLTTAASASDVYLYFDPRYVHISSGSKIVIIDPVSKNSELCIVDTVYSDGCTVTVGITGNFSTRCVVCLAINGKVAGAAFTHASITGGQTVTMQSWEEVSLQREGSTATLDTLSSLPIVTQNFFVGAEDNYQSMAEVLDFGGRRGEYNLETWLYMTKTLEFIVDRVFNPDLFDWWMLFFETMLGAQGAFLLLTHNADLNITAGVTAASTTLTTDKAHPEHSQNIFHGIRIKWSDGTTSDHTLTYATDTTITISPALDNPLPGTIEKVSYLLKMRMGDTVTLTHGHMRTQISLEAHATNFG